MIEELKDFPDNIVAFSCKGHVTKEDYDRVLVPAVDKAFERHKNTRLYYEIGDDFEGIDPSAVWTDFKTGVEHWLHSGRDRRRLDPEYYFLGVQIPDAQSDEDCSAEQGQ